MRVGAVAMLAVLAGCGGETAPPTRDPEPAAQQTAATSPDIAPGRVSQFTTLDEKACKTSFSDAETGDWAGRCPGAGGYQLEWSVGDLRDDLEIIRGTTRTRLDIPGIVADGAFDSIGRTLEWRGPGGQAPDVLVARVHVARPDGSSDSGRLTVVRLGERPCIVAVVPPGAGQSDKARALADGKLPDCLPN